MGKREAGQVNTLRTVTGLTVAEQDVSHIPLLLAPLLLIKGITLHRLLVHGPALPPGLQQKLLYGVQPCPALCLLGASGY